LGAGDGSFAKALAPSSGISGAPLPEGGGFLDQWLNHRLGKRLSNPDFDRQLVQLHQACG
jgi:hypothetical protein